MTNTPEVFTRPVLARLGEIYEATGVNAYSNMYGPPGSGKDFLSDLSVEGMTMLGIPAAKFGLGAHFRGVLRGAEQAALDSGIIVGSNIFERELAKLIKDPAYLNRMLFMTSVGRLLEEMGPVANAASSVGLKFLTAVALELPPDVARGRIMQRSEGRVDDEPWKIDRRFTEYERTLEVVEAHGQAGNLVRVNANQLGHLVFHDYVHGLHEVATAA